MTTFEPDFVFEPDVDPAIDLKARRYLSDNCAMIPNGDEETVLDHARQLCRIGVTKEWARKWLRSMCDHWTDSTSDRRALERGISRAFKIEERLQLHLLDRGEAQGRYRAMTLDELRALPPLEFLLADIIPVNSLIEMYGLRKSGKTFCALNLGLACATAIRFCDLHVKPGRVLHIVAEGNKTAIRNRVEAWLKDHPKAQRAALEAKIKDNWHLVGYPVHIDVQAILDEFLADNPGQWDLIIIDTLSRNMTGHMSDPKDMGAFVRGCDTIREQTGAAVLVVHHEGKDKSRGGMGSIALDNAVDGVLLFKREGKNRVLQIVVLRDSDDSQPDFLFTLDSVPLKVGMSDELDVRSAVLRFTGRRSRGPNAGDRLLAKIYEDEPKTQRDLIDDDNDLSKSTVSRAIKKLQEQGLLDGLSLTKEGIRKAELLQDDEAFVS